MSFRIYQAVECLGNKFYIGAVPLQQRDVMQLFEKYYLTHFASMGAGKYSQFKKAAQTKQIFPDRYLPFSCYTSWWDTKCHGTFTIPGGNVKNAVMKLIYFFFLMDISFALSRPVATNAFIQPIIRNDTSYHIIKSEASTYGYEIWVKNKLLIRQKSIPGLPGNRGFNKKQAAVKTARLVIKKLQQGIMPPTITANDLDSLGIH